MPGVQLAPQAQRSQAPYLLPAPHVPRPDQRLGQASVAAPVNDSLAPARDAAAAGRFPDSVREYLQYIARHPNDGDAYGELGNVYIKIGRFPEAAQNYYEAATRLVDAGHVNAAGRLMPIIERYEPMLAALIKEKIAPAGRRGDPR
jgi:tetratricopeptide (TPR) repeat protein